MRKTLVVALGLLLVCGLVGCGITGIGFYNSAPELTPLQRRVMESKELEGTFNDAFKATVSVLQDWGYTIKSSDIAGGLIYAELNTASVVVRTTLTINIEKFTEDRVKIRSSFSAASVTDSDKAKAYQDLYDDIQKEMFRRAQLNK
jgi:hypothetical protein